MITNIGSYNGQPFHLKLESALVNGDDGNCASGLATENKACSITINSNGAVDFNMKKGAVHPIRFTFIDASTGSQITPLPHFSFSVFDTGNGGKDALT